MDTHSTIMCLQAIQHTIDLDPEEGGLDVDALTASGSGRALPFLLYNFCGKRQTGLA